MNKLVELTKDFDVSPPIFRLVLDKSCTSVDVDMSEPIGKYKPTPIEGNVLSELVCDNYRERFDIKEGIFELDKHDIANRAMEEIRNSMNKFIEKNLEMRNPRQSKLYRWSYRNMPNTPDFNDVLIMLYKYLRSFCDADMRAQNTEHLNNALAILEAMREKHEQ